MGFGQLSAIPPPPFLSVSPLESMLLWRYDTPLQKGYLSNTRAIPSKTRQNACDTPLCDAISNGCCAMWGGISHWAAKFELSSEISYEKTLQIFLKFLGLCFVGPNDKSLEAPAKLPARVPSKKKKESQEKCTDELLQARRENGLCSRLIKTPRGKSSRFSHGASQSLLGGRACREASSLGPLEYFPI